MDNNPSFSCILCSELHILSSQILQQESALCCSCWSKQVTLFWLFLADNFPFLSWSIPQQKCRFFRDFKFRILEHKGKTSSPFPLQSKSTPFLPCCLFVSTSSWSNSTGKGKIKISRGSCSSWLAGGTLSLLHFEWDQLNRLRSTAIPIPTWPISISPSKQRCKIPYFSLAEVKTKLPAQFIYLLFVAEGEKFMLRQNLALFSIKIQHYRA